MLVIIAVHLSHLKEFSKYFYHYLDDGTSRPFYSITKLTRVRSTIIDLGVFSLECTEFGLDFVVAIIIIQFNNQKQLVFSLPY